MKHAIEKELPGQRKTPVSVILPTYNEKENIVLLIQEILRSTPEHTEIIVVDDNSQDGTWRIVEDMAKAQKNITLIHRIQKKGLVTALLEGIHFSSGEVLVWLDCDLSMPPREIPNLLRCLDRGHDVAIGSRFTEGGGVEIITGSRDSLLAYLMSFTLNRFLQLLLGKSLTDYTSGFIASRRKVLEAIPLKGDYGEYFIDLAYRSLKKGFRVAEIPYICRARRSGESKTGRGFFDYLRKGWKYVLLAMKLKFSRIKRDETLDEKS